MMMIRLSWRHPARRAASGARALGQGLLGVALIALAALAFLPSANAAPAPAAVARGSQTFPARAGVAGLAMSINGTPVPGADLYAAMQGIFVGDRPVDAKVKARLPGAAG
jgi:hypothetical protein